MAIIATPAMSIWVITMTTWATTTDAEVPILITTRNNISDIVTDIRVNVITHNHSNILLDKKPILDLNMIKIVKKTFIALSLLGLMSSCMHLGPHHYLQGEALQINAGYHGE